MSATSPSFSHFLGRSAKIVASEEEGDRGPERRNEGHASEVLDTSVYARPPRALDAAVVQEARRGGSHGLRRLALHVGDVRLERLEGQAGGAGLQRLPDDRCAPGGGCRAELRLAGAASGTEAVVTAGRRLGQVKRTWLAISRRFRAARQREPDVIIKAKRPASLVEPASVLHGARESCEGVSFMTTQRVPVGNTRARAFSASLSCFALARGHTSNQPVSAIPLKRMRQAELQSATRRPDANGGYG